MCEMCPEEYSGRGGQCHQCHVGDGEIPNENHTECICPAGTFDSYSNVVGNLLARDTSVEFSGIWHSACSLDSPDNVSTLDNKDDCDLAGGLWRGVNTVRCWNRSAKVIALETSEITRRCMPCPSCVTCKYGGILGVPSHYSIAAELHMATQVQRIATDAADQDSVHILNVFRCQHNGCPGIAPRTVNSSFNQWSENFCSGNHTGILCDSCRPGYHQSGDGDCLPCGLFTSQQVVLLLSLVTTFLLGILFWRKAVDNARKDEARFWFLVTSYYHGLSPE